MRVPTSTYRLQMGEGVGFREAAALVPYLDALGITDLYLSPIFANAGGSGYHVTDPTRLDPALGEEGDFRGLAEALRVRGMGLILDIVPNHLAASEENPWWTDVLTHGRDSASAPFFDIDWSRHGGKLLLPTHPEPEGWEEGAHTIRAYWRTAIRELNYRRFFDITDLVGLRQEDPAVFEATHGLVLRLVEESRVTGLRVDHVDGLRDPERYLERLRARAPEAYIVVEKVLAADEDLPGSPPVEGTTGYEAAADITGVLTDPEGAAGCDEVAARFTGDPTPFAAVAREAKRDVLRELFPSETRRLVEELTGLPDAPEAPLEELEAAVREVTASLRTYRTYVREGGAAGEDRRRIEEALEQAGGGGVRPESLAFLRRVMLAPDPGSAESEWLQRWQQLTGPAMAKGFEDTALYRHVALISRNEVGDDPGVPPPGPGEFHARMIARLSRWPRALTPTSTHDMKRAEDVRARIAVLSEMPEEWERLLGSWSARVSPIEVKGHVVPTPQERLLLFQTLIGAWPVAGEPDEGFVKRIQEAMVKSAREAKLHTSWLDPSEEHEAALRAAIEDLLADPRFRESLARFDERIAVHGAVNALAQVVLRSVLPGVPDLYAGAESWFQRLVDPDNRAPVDQRALFRALRELDGRAKELPGLADELRRSWRDGRLKVFVTAEALRFRRAHRTLFAEGAYIPLETRGGHADHIVSFARRRGDLWAVAVVPRLSTRVAAGWPLGEDWRATASVLPEGAPGSWVDVLTRERVESVDGSLPLAAVLRRFPVALLRQPG